MLKVAEVVQKVVDVVLKGVEIVPKMMEGASSVMTLKFHVVGETILMVAMLKSSGQVDH